MAGKPLESATAKINRAKYKLTQLDVQIGSDDAKGFRLHRETRTTGELVVCAHIPPDFFVNVSVIVGEIVYHARSALEHAVWEMVPSIHQHRHTGFPVFLAKTKAEAVAISKKGYYDRDGIAMIKGINTKAATLVESLQPFGPDYTKPLHILNEMWNRDKHRLLNTTVTYLHGMSLGYGLVPDGFPPNSLPTLPFVAVPANVKHGTELLRIPLPSGVQVYGEGATTSVVFDDGLVKGQPVSEFLLKLVQFTEGVINNLAATL